ncbi:MAG: hypothetical protein R3D05_20675 [Dongiaceae bacterium]
MKVSNLMNLLSIALAAIVAGGPFAQAEQYRVVSADKVSACDTSSQSGFVEGPRDVTLARADGDKLDAAVCVGEGSNSVVNVTWKANGYWKTSGNLSGGCAEILGASKIKVRAVSSNFHQAASYTACAKE